MIKLPPKTNKIPPTLLVTVQRNTNSLPLLIEVMSSPEVDVKLEEQGEFHYPDALDNNTSSSISKKSFNYPENMDDGVYEYQKQRRDFGSVDIRFLTQEGQSRSIYREIWDGAGDPRGLNQERDDDVEQYWAFDDDWLRNPYVAFEDDTIQDKRRCRRTNWSRQSFPTGNLIHEIDFLASVPDFVGEGAYREVFILQHQFLDKRELLVLKEIRYDLGMLYDDYEYVRVDSLVTERMTSNNQIVNLYAYTGYTMITEAFLSGDVEEDIIGMDYRSKHFDPLEAPEVVVLNNFTGSEKLKLALSMVKPVAALHNYKDGVIIHDDIQLTQYLWTDATKSAVKLNDFNRAEVMFWDEENQEYCKYRNGRGHGDWRAPEEYRNAPLDDKIDVWSLGNNFYSLLTGYPPFYDIEDDRKVKKTIERGSVTKIDPRFLTRSFAENRLFRIIQRCFVVNPDDRADINEIQGLLEEAIAEEERRKELDVTELFEDEVEEEEDKDVEQPSRADTVEMGEAREVESNFEDSASESRSGGSGDRHENREEEEDHVSEEEDHVSEDEDQISSEDEDLSESEDEDDEEHEPEDEK